MSVFAYLHRLHSEEGAQVVSRSSTGKVCANVILCVPCCLSTGSEPSDVLSEALPKEVGFYAYTHDLIYVQFRPSMEHTSK